MSKIKSLISACAAVLILAGCGGQRQFEAVEQICVPNIEKAAAMAAAEKVLSQIGFAVDKIDQEAGVLRSRPLAGGQFFEFWRKDNVGGANAAEASLHSIRRTAELNINQQEGRLCISCDAQVQRLSLPEQQINSSSQMAGIFSKSSESKQRFKLNRQQAKGMAWIDLGRDGLLETEILKRIEKQIKESQE